MEEKDGFPADRFLRRSLTYDTRFLGSSWETVYVCLWWILLQSQEHYLLETCCVSLDSDLSNDDDLVKFCFR